MKKIIFAASLLATTFFSAKAQDASTATTTSTDGYKPVAGDVTAEVGLVPGDGLFPSIELSPSGALNDEDENATPSGLIRVRYFLGDQLALRVGLNLDRTSNKIERPNETTTPSTPPATPVINTVERRRTSSTILNFGVEKHFSGTERLSTYIGADLLFASTGNKVTGENISSPNGDPTLGASFETKNNNAASGFGLRAIGGADYYIAKKVYLGLEFGWGGFMFYKEKDSETTSKADAASVEQTTKVKGDRATDLSAGVLGAFRLGFRF